MWTVEEITLLRWASLISCLMSTNMNLQSEDSWIILDVGQEMNSLSFDYKKEKLLIIKKKRCFDQTVIRECLRNERNHWGDFSTVSFGWNSLLKGKICENQF